MARVIVVAASSSHSVAAAAAAARVATAAMALTMLLLVVTVASALAEVSEVNAERAAAASLPPPKVVPSTMEYRTLQEEDGGNATAESGGDGQTEDKKRTIKDRLEDFFFDDYCDRTDKNTSALVDLSRWMTTSILDPSSRLGDVSLPGTHQSACYDFSTTLNPNDPEYERIDEASFNLPKKLIAPWICRFSLTQSLTLSEQLRAGVRYLDLRIDYDSDAKAFRASHVLFGTDLQTLLNQVSAFANANPAEIVVVEISELVNPDVSDAERTEMQRIILDSLGTTLVPVTDDGVLPTIGEMRDARTTVLVAVQDDAVAKHDLIWDRDNIVKNTFANTVDLNHMIAYNTLRLVEFQEDKADAEGVVDRLYKLSWILTPDVDYIKDGIFSGSVYKLAKETNGALANFAFTNKGKQLGNVLLVDYVETSPLFQALNLTKESTGAFAVDAETSGAGAGGIGVMRRNREMATSLAPMAFALVGLLICFC